MPPAPEPSRALLRLAGVTVGYSTRAGFFGKRRMLRAVDDVSLTIRAGEILGLVGESGSGKSTMGRIAAGTEKPSAGSAEIDGTEVTGIGGARWRRQRRAVQVIHQDPENALDPRIAIASQIEEPLIIHGEGNAAERRRRVAEMLQAVGLRDLGDRYPHQLSGGQLQRAVIARALVLEPKLLICDEPVSALDVSVQAQIVNLLKDLHRRLDLAYLFISHDLGIVRHMSDRIGVMYLGRIVEIGPAEAVFEAPRHPYTKALLSAIPVSTPWARRPRTKLRGEPPSPLDPPPGCTFHPRCQYASDECARTVPPLDGEDERAAACLFWREIEAGERLPKPLPPESLS